MTTITSSKMKSLIGKVKLVNQRVLKTPFLGRINLTRITKSYFLVVAVDSMRTFFKSYQFSYLLIALNKLKQKSLTLDFALSNNNDTNDVLLVRIPSSVNIPTYICVAL